jgi:hypothetical protein
VTRVIMVVMGIVTFGVGGLVCLMRPRQLQKWWIRHHEAPGLWRWNLCVPLMHWEGWIIGLRLTGLGMLLAAVLLSVALALNAE